MASLNWSTAADWDNGQLVDNNGFLVHDNVGDRSDDQLQKEYLTSDQSSGLNDSLVLYSHMDESSGPIDNAASGVTDSGTLSGSPTLGATGALETTCVEFDGSDDYIEYSDKDDYSIVESSDSGLAITCFVYWNSSGAGTIVDKENEFKFGTKSNGDLFFSTYGSEVTYSDSITTGIWFSIGVYYDIGNSEVKFFPAGSNLASGGKQLNDTSSNTDNPLSIGAETVSNTASNHFEGKLDSVRIYSNPLSTSYINDRIRATGTGISSYWTGSKSFSSDQNSLQINNVDADTVSTTTEKIQVTVHSDPDDDGTFEETSDTITLDGSGGPYSVSGISSASKTYRLETKFGDSSSTTVDGSGILRSIDLASVQNATLDTASASTSCNAVYTNLGSLTATADLVSTNATSLSIDTTQTAEIGTVFANCLSNSISATGTGTITATADITNQNNSAETVSTSLGTSTAITDVSATSSSALTLSTTSQIALLINTASTNNTANDFQVGEVVDMALASSNTSSLAISGSISGNATATIDEAVIDNQAYAIEQFASFVADTPISQVIAREVRSKFFAAFNNASTNTTAIAVNSKMVADFDFANTETRTYRSDLAGASPARVSVGPSNNIDISISNNKNQISTRVKSDRLLDTE